MTLCVCVCVKTSKTLILFLTEIYLSIYLPTFLSIYLSKYVRKVSRCLFNRAMVVLEFNYNLSYLVF